MFTVAVDGKVLDSFEAFHDAVDAANTETDYTLANAVITDTATGLVAVGLEEAQDWDDIFWALPEGAPEEGAVVRPFDWERDLGNGVTPADCVTQAAEIGQDLATYAAVLAADVSASWSRMHPSAGDPPADLEEGILAALDDAAADDPPEEADDYNFLSFDEAPSHPTPCGCAACVMSGMDVDERVTDALAARRYEF